MKLGAAVTNQPPTADAGDDQSIHASDTVNLDGGESFDDNTASVDLAYSWSFDSQPVDNTATLTDANTATPSFVADLTGDYIVQLIVTDGDGADSDPSFVTVGSSNLAPTAAATVDFSLAIIGQAVNFDGGGSTDPEMDPLTYAWTITAAPPGSTAVLVGANTATPSLAPDLEGDYEVTLTVSDFLGAGTPDTVEITATTADGFAEIQIIAACDLVEGLAPNQVKTKGNQRALCNVLRQAIRQLQNGQVENALDKLGKALDRTDGCVLNENGLPDGNGPSMDWVTDCDAQIAVYGFIDAAIAALEL